MKCRDCGKVVSKDNMGAWNELCLNCLRNRSREEQKEQQKVDKMINRQIKEGLR